MSDVTVMLQGALSPVDPIWVASSVVLFRNIGGFRFPQKMKGAEIPPFVSLMKSAFAQLPGLENPVIFPGEKVSLLDREYLWEHFLSLPLSFPSLKEGGDLGQLFILDKSRQFLACIGGSDHLRLHAIDSKPRFEGAYERVTRIANALAEKLPYAFSPEFGYLTADPRLCGTALLCFSYLHVPALRQAGQLSNLLSSFAKESVLITPLQGGIEELFGDLLVVRNRFTLGVTEEESIESVRAVASKIAHAEKNLRETLKKELSPFLRDQISRSLGLITHSIQLQTPEALGALSLLKLGVELGWMEGQTRERIDELFSKCRSAHLSTFASITDPTELSKKRAELLRGELQALKLSA